MNKKFKIVLIVLSIVVFIIISSVILYFITLKPSKTKCNKNCKNGKCNNNYVCICNAGYTGNDCSKCDSGYGGFQCQTCPSKCNTPNGVCQDDLTCKCEKNWSGKLCDIYNICSNQKYDMKFNMYDPTTNSVIDGVYNFTLNDSQNKDNKNCTLTVQYPESILNDPELNKFLNNPTTISVVNNIPNFNNMILLLKVDKVTEITPFIISPVLKGSTSYPIIWNIFWTGDTSGEIAGTIKMYKYD